MPRREGYARVAVAALLCLLAGCGTPLQKVESFVTRQAWQSERVEGEGFRHRVFRNRVAGSGELHVYIEGDGAPYRSRFVVADDPTPRRPLMLHVMALDRAPSVYVGRPCYFDTVRDPGCGPEEWTRARFSEAVVASLARVIENERTRAGARCVEIYAHSGGAALAVLVVSRVACVSRLVTVAGNLDSDGWTSLHGYSSLTGSLNPATVRLDTTATRALHLVGEKDRVTPASFIAEAARQIGGEVRVIPRFTHQCCWEEIWPAVLQDAFRH